MRWHWLHRSFVAAFEACPTESDWVDAYVRSYLHPHYSDLMELHFRLRGFPTATDVVARIRQLGRSAYGRSVHAIKANPRLEQMLEDTVDELMAILKSDVPGLPIYVIVGLQCTNIYTVTIHAAPATVLCIEAVDADPAGLRLLLAHEASHWARQAIYGPDILSASVGERLASEGLAITFSRKMCPGLADWDYCFVPETTYQWVTDHRPMLDRLLESSLQDCQLMDTLFSRSPLRMPASGMPPRTGYVYGYQLTRLAADGLSPDAAVRLPWRSLLR